MTVAATAKAREARGCIYSAGRWIDGVVRWANGRITHVEGARIDAADVHAPYILPGFVDLHVHGGGGRDLMEAGDAIDVVTQTHARFGTTSLLATTMTASHEQILAALQAIEHRRQEPMVGRSAVIGVHLEGPYINAGKLGAQPDVAREATREEVSLYCDAAAIRVVTLAPECLTDHALIAWLAARQVRVQAGHSLASYEQGCEALSAGVSGFTHLFNAMPPLHHREPGLLGAALAHAEHAELIPDLLHVHPGAIRLALRAIPSLYCVTDGTAACGMPDGDYRLGTQSVHKCRNGVRLADGGLAGSCLTMDQAFRNLLTLGLSVGEASDRLSAGPADYLGEAERGRVAVGAWADLVVMDDSFQLTRTVCAGTPVMPAAQ